MTARAFLQHLINFDLSCSCFDVSLMSTCDANTDKTVIGMFDPGRKISQLTLKEDLVCLKCVGWFCNEFLFSNACSQVSRSKRPLSSFRPSFQIQWDWETPPSLRHLYWILFMLRSERDLSFLPYWSRLREWSSSKSIRLPLPSLQQSLLTHKIKDGREEIQ